jgi:hypothetical protein
MMPAKTKAQQLPIEVLSEEDVQRLTNEFLEHYRLLKEMQQHARDQASLFRREINEHVEKMDELEKVLREQALVRTTR